MKNTKLITMLCLGALIACSPSKKGLEPTSEQVSPRERLIENLRAIPQKGIMFGHHDDTVYGIGWEFDEGGSDVQKVCGDYPAVISFDLGEIELGGDKSQAQALIKYLSRKYARKSSTNITGEAWYL